MMIDLLGRIVFFDGPFTGNSYDGHIWNHLAESHPLEEGELILADGHFTICENVATPIRQNQVQSEEDWIYNLVLQHYRARIEHVNGFFVRYLILIRKTITTSYKNELEEQNINKSTYIINNSN
jgi:hypothetical protein